MHAPSPLCVCIDLIFINYVDHISLLITLYIINVLGCQIVLCYKFLVHKKLQGTFFLMNNFVCVHFEIFSKFIKNTIYVSSLYGSCLCLLSSV